MALPCWPISLCLGADVVASSHVFELLVFGGAEFNRAMPQVWAPNHGAVRDAKGAHQDVCGA